MFFFRFRIGNEAGGGAAVGDVLNMSGGDLQLQSDQQQGQAMLQAKNRPKLKDMEGLRASQSFDESVIQAFFGHFEKKLKPKKTLANFRKTQANYSKTQ